MKICQTRFTDAVVSSSSGVELIDFDHPVVEFHFIIFSNNFYYYITLVFLGGLEIITNLEPNCVQVETKLFFVTGTVVCTSMGTSMGTSACFSYQ